MSPLDFKSVFKIDIFNLLPDSAYIFSFLERSFSKENMNLVLNQDTRKKNECVSHLLSMIPGYNKPKSYPVSYK